MTHPQNNTLLPVPQSEVIHDGVFTLTPTVTLVPPATSDARLLRAVERFVRSLPCHMRPRSAQEKPSRDRQGAVSQQTPDPATVTLALTDPHDASERYRLNITPRRVTVDGAGPAGLFHGLTTLRRIADVEGNHWRCRTIDDGPDLSLRGLSLDVSRGKVPTLETLMEVVDRLAAVKINHLQLYVEHTFDFRFDRDIGRGCSPLTHDDIARLDDYGRDRFIDLVPSLACFGHMGRILSLSRYRHLAEIPCTDTWENQPWPQRLRGLTINPRDPDARRLLESMLDEFLPLFSSGWANVCADETHDLGRGLNRAYCERIGRGRLYVDHLKFLIDVCRRHQRRTMFWSDVIRSFPNRIRDLPDDVVLLDWGYEPDSDFPAADSPHRNGRDVCVCPGTRGWNRLVNGLATAEANIDHAVAAARTHGATGLIVTDWGDHGHFNMLACSMPAIVRAAARAWNTRHIDPTSFDRSLESHLFAPGPTGLLAALRDVGRLGDRRNTWSALRVPQTDPRPSGSGFPTDDQIHTNAPQPATPTSVTTDRLRIGEAEARAHEEHVHAALTLLNTLTDSNDATEWRLGCRASGLLARRILDAPSHGTSRGLQSARTEVRGSQDAPARLADDIAAFRDDYAVAWNARNRPERLHEITGALTRVVDDLRSLARASRSSV